MRRRDHANVDLDRIRVADALELALLQHAKKLRLERGTHRADFVEKQRALVCLFEPSLPRADGAGERTADMTEQFRFEQRFRNRAAVQRDEAVRTPRAIVMNCPSGEFFAGAGLSSDEHRARCRGDGLEQLKQLAHDSAAADEPVDAIAILELRSQIRVFRLEATLL